MSQRPDPNTAPKVAMVGLGQMGHGIARNLDAAGLLVWAHDTNPDAVSAAKFSARVASIGSDDQAGDIVVFAVPSCADIAGHLSDAPPRRGQIILDLTTSDPARSRALAAQMADLGVGYVDAAMTGGAAGADAGALTLMIGGAQGDVAACRPVFDAIAGNTFHLGDIGAGHAMKLIHNLILHSSFLATCEGLRLADRAGINLDSAVDVLNAGNARSFVTEVRFPRDILSGTMNARSRIANLEKDLRLALDFAATSDARVPYATLTRTILAQSLSAGQADADFSNLFLQFEDLIDAMKDAI